MSCLGKLFFDFHSNILCTFQNREKSPISIGSEKEKEIEKTRNEQLQEENVIYCCKQGLELYMKNKVRYTKDVDNIYMG